LDTCWEYFHCIKDQCTMFGRSDVPCWTVEGTLCNNVAAVFCRSDAGAGSKKEACARSRCIYFEAARKWQA
jgi:hypothetical protein